MKVLEKFYCVTCQALFTRPEGSEHLSQTDGHIVTAVLVSEQD